MLKSPLFLIQIIPVREISEEMDWDYGMNISNRQE